MRTSIILCISARQATAGLWRWRRFASCATFADDETGHAALRQFLHTHRNASVRLMVDTAEEDYRLETLPHVRGNARKEMVERKLGQLYRHTGYRTGHLVGREPDRRRDDRYLFMALTNANLIAPWLKILEDSQSPLAGIHLLPVVSPLLLQTLDIESTELLLMTRQNAGLRQTYIRDGIPQLSRLTSLAGMDERQIEELHVSEAEKTLLYLSNLHATAPRSRLHLVFPGTGPSGAELAQRLERSLVVSCISIGGSALAGHLKLSEDLLTRYPDLLHMQPLARYRPPANLAQDALTRPYRLHQLRTGINIANVVCTASAALAIGANLVAAADLETRARQLAMQARDQQRRYIEVARDFPKTPLPGNDLKAAAVMADTIERLNRTPQRLMQAVSAALEARPDIRLNRLRWRLAGDPDEKDTDASSRLYEIGLIDGEIADFSGDFRAALDSVEALAVHLRNDKRVDQVAILQQPVNTSSLASLQGNTQDQQARQLPTAQFRVRIVLRPEPAP